MEWREAGDTTEAVVRAEFGRRSSPLLAEAGAVWAAMSGRGIGRLVLAILAKEQQYGTDTAMIPAASRNPMSLKARPRPGGTRSVRDGAGGWERFPSYAAGVRAGVGRLLDPAGPYAATRTLEELCAVYAPASDGNDPREYARVVEGYVARYRGLEARGALDWTPVPYPPLVDLVVAKPGEGAGFDRCPPRGPRIVGVCDHITAGEGGIEFYAAFFGTGGERAWDALVDVVIGRDGRVGLLNDWRDPSRGGTCAGWANGGSNGLEGRGVAFAQALGTAAINERLVSKEHVAREGQPITDAQLEASIALDVAILQERRLPWHEYPFSAALGGIAVSYRHSDFSTKSCPAEPWTGTYGPIKEREVRARLTLAQTGSTNPSAPTGPSPTAPPVGDDRAEPDRAEPDRAEPGTIGADDLAVLFGTLDRAMADGSVREYPFDPAGPIGAAWLARARWEGIFPEAGRWLTSGGRQVVTFANGWVLVAPRIDDVVGWRWATGGDPGEAGDGQGLADRRPVDRAAAGAGRRVNRGSGSAG